MGFLSGIVNVAINPVNLASLAMGPAGWASLAMRTIGAQIGLNVLQNLGQQLGLPQSFTDTIKAGFAAQIGLPGLATQSMSQAVSGLGFTPAQEGQLARAGEDAIQSLVTESLRNNGGFKDEDGQTINVTGKAGTDFFTMFAKVMGQKLNDGFKTLADKSDSTNWKDGAAVTEFQAEQQKFGFFMTSVSTAIKTLGDALNSMARKN